MRSDKTPHTKRGHHEATVDKTQLQAWWRQYPDALVGVNAGTSGLVCLDIDMGEDDAGNAHDGWSSLIEEGLDSFDSFHYKTRRGGDHYIFEPIDARHLGPTKRHATPNGTVLDSIDRRAGSSYFVFWGEEVPVARDEFAPAPEWLLTESAEPNLNPYGGSIDEWLARCEPGDPDAFLLAWADNIPATDFGHAEMIEQQAALIGMGADSRAGIPWALERLRVAWLRPPYDTDQYETDWNLALAGAIAKYGAFSPPLSDLAKPAGVPIDYVDAAGRIQDSGFFTAWTGLPVVVTPESLQERVRIILAMCLEDGNVTRQEAIEIAWQSAARKVDGCPITTREGVEALAVNTFLVEEQFSPEPEAPVAPEPKKKQIRLLSLHEEAELAGTRWWGDEFMERMRDANPVMTESYYRLNRWMILSLVFASKAVFKKDNDTTYPLNFYGLIAGPSGTGKSESMNCIEGMLDAFYVMDLSPDIGGDATAAGITEALIQRDGQSSFFHADEADKILRDWSNQQGEFRGMKQKVTEFYGGKVPALYRATKKDISGKKATTYLCVHLTGVYRKIADAIEPDDWESGFFNRFILAIGTKKNLTPEQKRVRLMKRGQQAKESGLGRWYAQWAATFRQTVQTKLTTPDGKPVLIEFNDDVEDRHHQFVEKCDAITANHDYPERVEPTMTRYKDTALKCAALVAISDRRTTVEVADYLVALAQIAEWMQNSLDLIEDTDETFRARQADRLADVIRQRGGQVLSQELHSMKGLRGDWKNVEGLLSELKAQDRIEELPLTKEKKIIRLTEGVPA